MMASSARIFVLTSSGLISSRPCSDRPSFVPWLREPEDSPLCMLLDRPSVRARIVYLPQVAEISLAVASSSTTANRRQEDELNQLALPFSPQVSSSWPRLCHIMTSVMPYL